MTSPDIDGLISAAFIAREYRARLVGLYTTSHLLLFDSHGVPDAKGALWLDHDINHSAIQCIGQHLIAHRAGDRLPTRHPHCFNPNMFFAQPWSDSFKGVRGRNRDKYPFATCHLLLDAHGFSMDDCTASDLAALAHADGSILSAQRYPVNCKIWQETMFQKSDFIDFLLSDQARLKDTLDAQRLLVSDLAEAGIRKGGSAVRGEQSPEGFQGLSGHQSIAYASNHNLEKFREKFNRVLEVLRQKTQFHISDIEHIQNPVPGKVTKEYPDRIPAGEFDEWLRQNHVFSHAFVALSTLRYTQMEDSELWE